MQEHDFILNYSLIKPKPVSFDTDKLDWKYILEQAKAHKVASILFSNIKNLSVPADTLKEFENFYTFYAFHNMLFIEELQQILQEAKNNNIKLIILKGPLLAQDIYKNIALRPFSDIDILVKKDDLNKMEDILKRIGYFSENEDFYKKYHFHLPLYKPGKLPIHIELHWEFVDKFILHKIDMDTVWDKALNNALPPEINLIYLLLHIEKHAFFNKAIYDRGNTHDWIFTNPSGNQLIWYIDLYEFINEVFIKANNTHWLDNIIQLSREWCIENVIYYNLHMLNSLYPLPLLKNLPRPKLGFLKKHIYTIASKRINKAKISEDMQLRPIRAIDLVNYLFPGKDVIKNYYSNNKHTPVTILYIYHFFAGSFNIVKEFFGIICQLFVK